MALNRPESLQFGKNSQPYRYVSMKSLHLILNGKSVSNDALRDAVSKIRQDGVQVSVHVTYEMGDAKQFAAAFAHDPNSIVIAAGGDGTVNEVVNGLLQSGSCRCSMSILPLGTANDFATSAGINTDSIEQAMRLTLSSKASMVDVGRMDTHYFLNMASGGFGAEVTTATSPFLKTHLGGAAYALQALAKSFTTSGYQSKIMTADNTYEGKIILFAVANGRLAGGGVAIAPTASIVDGLLDVLVVPDRSDTSPLSTLQSLVGLTWSDDSDCYRFKSNQLKIEAETSLQVTLDGELYQSRCFDFQVMEKILALHLPENCPLLTAG